MSRGVGAALRGVRLDHRLPAHEGDAGKIRGDLGGADQGLDRQPGIARRSCSRAAGSGSAPGIAGSIEAYIAQAASETARGSSSATVENDPNPYLLPHEPSLAADATRRAVRAACVYKVNAGES